MNCLIVDDEPLARELLASYVAQIPNMACAGLCQSALEAFSLLHQQSIDVVFMDIEMPGITGINFLKSLKTAPKVIFTTAYPEYAVDAFEIEAVDYLLKPITFERFIKAVHKLGNHTEKVQADNAAVAPNDHLFLKIDRRLVKVDFEDICYIEALGDYLKIHTKENALATYMTMNKIEQLLPPARFIRIHRSTIVNKATIKFIEGNFICVNDTHLSIGLTYREALISNLG